MSFGVGAPMYFPPSYTKFTLIIVLLMVTWETCVGSLQNVDQMKNQGEITEEVGNQFGPPESDVLHFLNGENEEDALVPYKRHLGAIAAISGSRSLTGSKSFASPSKKHLGSIAALSGRVAPGRKLELSFPSTVDMYKRHLASLMASSGAKPKSVTRSLKESPHQMDSPLDTYEMETPQMSYDMMNSRFNVVTPPASTVDSDFVPENIQLPQEIFMGYAREPSNSWSRNSFQPMNSPVIESESSFNEDGLNGELGLGENDDVGAYKSKRFLGPLARGGWFPRHFRGIVSENSFGKRHIGALARLGWMPNAKANGRLSMLLGEQSGDVGLKRNDVSARRRMLYHFTAPSLWTSPRGK